MLEEFSKPLKQSGAFKGLNTMYMYTSYMQVEFPSIYHLERHEWSDVLAIREPAHPLFSSSYFRDWEQAIAAGHLHNTAASDDAVTRRINL